MGWLNALHVVSLTGDITVSTIPMGACDGKSGCQLLKGKDFFLFEMS